MKIFRILKKPKNFVDSLTLKEAFFYLIIFSTAIVFLLGLLFGAIIL